MIRTRPSERGATLLEVIVACSLTMLLAAVAVPNSRSMRAPFAVRSASRQLEADLQGARMRAITRGTRYRITFNNSGTGYWLQRETAVNSFTSEGGLQRFPAGVAIGTVSGSALFDSRGMLTANVTIPLTNPDANQKTVTVNVLGQTTIS